MTKKRCFITGATGLVGSQIARQLLSDGYEVRALTREFGQFGMAGDIAGKIDWAEGDVLNIFTLEKALDGCGFAIHAAAIVSFAEKEREQMYRVNVGGTANLVDACIRAGINKLCFVSSVAALGRVAGNNTPIAEDAQWDSDSNLNTHYAISKHLAEREVWRGYAEGLDCVIVNPSVVIGTGDWTRSSLQLFKYVWDEKQFFPLGTINTVDVRDVAAVSVKLLGSSIVGERFILNAHHTPYRDYLEKIALQFGKKAPNKPVKPWMAEIAWRAEAIIAAITGDSPLMTKETVRMSAHDFNYDSTKIQKSLGHSFLSLDESLQWACASFLKKTNLLGKS